MFVVVSEKMIRYLWSFLPDFSECCPFSTIKNESYSTIVFEYVIRVYSFFLVLDTFSSVSQLISRGGFPVVCCMVQPETDGTRDQEFAQFAGTTCG